MVTAFSTLAYNSGSFLGWANFLAPLAFVIRQILNIWKAKTAGFRIFAIKSMTYTTVAWAYGDKCPPKVPSIDIQRVNAWANNRETGYVEAWKDAAKEMLLHLNKNKTINDKNLSPDEYALLLRLVSNGDRLDLAFKIYSSMENHFPSAQDKIYFKGFYHSIRYPN